MTDVSSDPKSDVVSSLDDDSLGSAAPIKLVSKDGKEFLLDRKYAFISNLIKTSLENDPSATEVPMPGVKADVLAKVVEFMAHHKGVQPPIIEKPLKSKVRTAATASDASRWTAPGHDDTTTPVRPLAICLCPASV